MSGRELELMVETKGGDLDRDKIKDLCDSNHMLPGPNSVPVGYYSGHLHSFGPVHYLGLGVTKCVGESYSVESVGTELELGTGGTYVVSVGSERMGEEISSYEGEQLDSNMMKDWCDSNNTTINMLPSLKCVLSVCSYILGKLSCHISHLKVWLVCDMGSLHVQGGGTKQKLWRDKGTQLGLDCVEDWCVSKMSTNFMLPSLICCPTMCTSGYLETLKCLVPFLGCECGVVGLTVACDQEAFLVEGELSVWNMMKDWCVSNIAPWFKVCSSWQFLWRPGHVFCSTVFLGEGESAGCCGSTLVDVGSEFEVETGVGEFDGLVC